MKAKKATANVVGPSKVPIAVKINGQILKAELEPCITLLDAMREYWNLTGAKRVCDRATCGACTVLLNGRRVYACSLLAIDVAAEEITTIESIPDSDPVKQAFVSNDAMQCGFCTPGFVMSCKGFPAEYPNPTADDLLKGMGGNLCRCGSYVGIQKALARAVSARRASGTPKSAARPPRKR
jgi:xanthine dehydrogenase YagT iron-sulfur-binding subunit